MLAIAPAGVRPDRLSAADDPDRTCGCVFAHPVNRTSLNGVTGKPSLATVEKGRVLNDWLLKDLVGLLERGRIEKPPLDRSYIP
jgi:creatinine amidohydrolase